MRKHKWTAAPGHFIIPSEIARDVAVFAATICLFSYQTLAAPDLYGSVTQGPTNFLIKIDPATANYQVQGFFGFNIQGLAYAPDIDQLFGLSAQTHRVYRIDPSDASATPIDAGPHSYGNANGLAYDSRRKRLIGSSNTEGGASSHQLFAIDPISGAYSTLATISGAADVEGLGYDPIHDSLFGLADFENEIVTIDPVTGIATPLIQLPAKIWRGLEYDVFQDVFYASDAGSGGFYVISPSSSPSVQFIADTASGLQGLAVTPEPITLPVLFFAAAVAGRNRRIMRFKD